MHVGYKAYVYFGGPPFYQPIKDFESFLKTTLIGWEKAGPSKSHFSIRHVLRKVLLLQGPIAQMHNKRTCRLVFHTIHLMLNAKQGSCEYELFKSYGLTQ